MAAAPLLDVAIVGGGFGGLAALLRLRRARPELRLRLYEAEARLGGTWRDNTYPGCACDVPSLLYSLSMAPKPDWSRSYSQQAEILAYMESLVARFGLAPWIEFGARAARLDWDDAASCWRIGWADAQRAAVHARHVVLATGPLARPKAPAIDGLERFAGRTLHTWRWPADVDLRGRRVVVVGTGASAIQLVPAIAPQVERLTVLQRSAPWVLPRLWDRPLADGARWRLAHLPGWQRLLRWAQYWGHEARVGAFVGSVGPLHRLMQRVLRRQALAYLRSQIRDPELRRRATPDYAPGCKRILVSSDYYAALTRPNVTLVDRAAAQVVAEGVVDAAGCLHPADLLVLATGFDTHDWLGPLAVHGRGGASLNARWAAEGAQTHLGLGAHGFPNLHFLLGPNTGLGHNSVLFMIEAQLNHLLDLLEHARRHDPAAAYEPRLEVQRQGDAALQRRLAASVWASGCSSWYRQPNGRIDTLWPGSTLGYWWRTRRFDARAYLVRPAAPGAARA
jgi:cation diffusion facilitator CzcD-associated flavoprotein CzcO